MSNLQVNLMNSTEEQTSISFLRDKEQISELEKQHHLKVTSMPSMNFWGQGAYKDDFDFSKFDSLSLLTVVK